MQILKTGRRLAVALALSVVASSVMVASSATSAGAATCSNWVSFGFGHRDGVARTDGRYSRSCTDDIVYITGSVTDTLNDNRSARAQVVYDNGRKSSIAIAGGGVGSSAGYTSFTGPHTMGFKICLEARNTWGASYNDCRRI